MGSRRIAVKLWGKQNRKAMIDPGATEGAIVGENLRWSDGSQVTEVQIRGGSSGSIPTDGGVIQSPTLWALIVGIPAFIKALAGLAGEGLVVKRAGDTSAVVSIDAVDPRIIVTDGDAQAGNPTIGAADWPVIKSSIGSSESWTIPAGFQMIVMEGLDIQGSLVIDGDLYVHTDQPGIPDPIGPDFTYNVGGDLTQIDYDAGEQKLFTYNGGGDLERVDFIQDGVTLRKDFFYSSGDLDYVDEYYV